jgi:hypothetical protein
MFQESFDPTAKPFAVFSCATDALHRTLPRGGVKQDPKWVPSIRTDATGHQRRGGDYDHQWRKMSRRYRLLTAGLLQASAYAPVRSRIVPAATALPKIFAGIINQLAE